MTKHKRKSKTVFAQMIDEFWDGSLTKTAESFDFSIQTAANYRDGRAVDEKVCVKAEKITDGKYTRQMLRPHDWHEIWPELIEAA